MLRAYVMLKTKPGTSEDVIRRIREKVKEVVQAEGPRALVARWMKYINEKDFEEMKELLKAFGVTIYKAKNPYPAEEICHFGPLC